MKRDYASVIYPQTGSQDFWNIMDRFTDWEIRDIMDLVRDRILDLCYDFTHVFFDA